MDSEKELKQIEVEEREDYCEQCENDGAGCTCYCP